MLFKILIYRQGKTWMFDDKERNIQAEPFVCGASELIQKHLRKKGLGRRKKNVSITFSTQEIGEADIVLTVTEKCYPMKIGKMQDLFGGHLMTHISNTVSLGYDKTKNPTSAYYIDQEGDQCWLCPAQLKFFGQVADTIYARID
jgi:hypothetical protein